MEYKENIEEENSGNHERRRLFECTGDKASDAPYELFDLDILTSIDDQYIFVLLYRWFRLCSFIEVIYLLNGFILYHDTCSVRFLVSNIFISRRSQKLIIMPSMWTLSWYQP